MKVPFFLQISGYYSQLYSNARISQCYCWKIATANGSALVQISGYYSQLYSNARISQCYCWKIATANGSALVNYTATLEYRNATAGRLQQQTVQR
ncbi:hypothetical protein QE152_g38340 [Popillia japonica]|uniref:Uncharacterized protein n=1 Tax=Popillia japonica TaxID=7064 RepID=A0AAW1HYM1_POPJA